MRRLLESCVPALFLWLLVALAACDLVNLPAAETAVTPSPVTLTPDATPLAETAVEPSASLTMTQATAVPAARLIQIWLPADPPDLSEQQAKNLVAQLNDFARSPTGQQVDIRQKSLSGTGSMLNYLRTGHGLANAALPDLMILPVDQLAVAAGESLIVPLNGLLDTASMETTLYPAAMEMVQVKGQMMGYPIMLTNLTHLAYDSGIVTQTVPLNWSTFVSTTQRSLIFAAGGREGATLTLQLYMAQGGEIVTGVGQPALLPEPLTNALELLTFARLTNNLIDPGSLDMKTAEQSWAAFRGERTSYVITTASQFLAERAAIPTLNYSPIPGPEGALVSLVDGWALVITAVADDRRALAAAFLQTIIQTPNLSEWSQTNQLLPADRAVFATWPEDPYILFLQSQLAAARPNPLGSGSNLALALQNAVFEVLSLTQTPLDAAESALTTLAP